MWDTFGVVFKPPSLGHFFILNKSTQLNSENDILFLSLNLVRNPLSFIIFTNRDYFYSKLSPFAGPRLGLRFTLWLILQKTFN